jgi:hypothetical protein
MPPGLPAGHLDQIGIVVPDLNAAMDGYIATLGVAFQVFDMDQTTSSFSGSSADIDIDSSSDVLVAHCDIDCNDDAICLKAGRDADGLRVPTAPARRSGFTKTRCAAAPPV